MSFPLGYFKHFSNESVQKTWCPQAPWVGTSRHLQPSQAPGRGGRGLWAPPSDGSQPWACLSGGLSLGSAAAKRKPGEGGRAPWGCLVPLPHSHTVRNQFHCQPVLPMSSLQQPSLLSILLPNTFGQLDGVFFNCMWKFRGWGNLKNTSWNSDTQTAECLK